MAQVTGANKGIGLATVEGICKALGKEGVVYLTARDVTRGEEAVKALSTKGLTARWARFPSVFILLQLI